MVKVTRVKQFQEDEVEEWPEANRWFHTGHELLIIECAVTDGVYTEKILASYAQGAWSRVSY